MQIELIGLLEMLNNTDFASSDFQTGLILGLLLRKRIENATSKFLETSKKTKERWRQA